MGDIDGVSFYTGLPDGDYCDIVDDCAQTVAVRDGWAKVSPYQEIDPVVAICVGCE